MDGFRPVIMTSQFTINCPPLSLGPFFGAWDKTAQPAQSSDDPGCCCAPWVNVGSYEPWQLVDTCT